MCYSSPLFLSNHFLVSRQCLAGRSYHRLSDFTFEKGVSLVLIHVMNSSSDEYVFVHINFKFHNCGMVFALLLRHSSSTRQSSFS